MAPRRRRGSGVHPPPRKPPHALRVRLWLHWQSLYPFVRMVAVVGLLVAIGYAVVAAIWILPSDQAILIVPAVLLGLAAIALAIVMHGEPNDQSDADPPLRHEMSDAEFNQLDHSFGHDPVLLREEVTCTLRHELGHHLGYDEQGVRSLGL